MNPMSETENISILDKKAKEVFSDNIFIYRFICTPLSELYTSIEIQILGNLDFVQIFFFRVSKLAPHT